VNNSGWRRKGTVTRNRIALGIKISGDMF